MGRGSDQIATKSVFDARTTSAEEGRGGAEYYRSNPLIHETASRRDTQSS